MTDNKKRNLSETKKSKGERGILTKASINDGNQANFVNAKAFRGLWAFLFCFNTACHDNQFLTDAEVK